MPKFLVYGQEPYLIDKYRKEITGKIETPEFNYMETDVFTDEVAGFLSQYPMLGSEKVLIFRAKSLKECEELLNFISKKGKNPKVYLFVKEVDKRTKLFKQFTKDEIKAFDKVSQEVLEKTIMQYIRNRDCEIAPEAYQQYLMLINYYADETNLYDVLHSLDRLCSAKVITSDIVAKMVINRETEDVFSLIRLIMEDRYDDVYHQADLILQSQQNNIIGVLSLLLRNYRLAYKRRVCNCSLKALGAAYNTYVPDLSVEACDLSMNILDETISKIKRGFYKPEVALKVCLAKLCQISQEK